ncbi:MAG: glycosyltransferase [Candidatus Bathyarchaeota archaeon]|nr:glycosyltransferase [Candidatus Bathyarchaeota archaeon]MDH5787233.1 glycosyltransferase [Candidatus Bathyarchaeota archaeon]
MNAIIFSWEYPPRIVGQLANHVRELAAQLVRNSVGIYVVTYHDYLTEQYNETDGVKTYRVVNPVRTHIGVLTWVLTLNQEVERAAANIYYSVNKHVDVIDVYDWHFIPAAVTLKKALNIPFIYSVESLEEHRSHGANSPFNMAIKSIEWLGMYEAARLIVKSEWMRDETYRVYKVPMEKMQVIPSKSANWTKRILETYKDVTEGANPK